MRKLVSLALGLAGLLGAVPVRAQLSLLDKEVDKGTGSDLELVSVFDKLPPTGYAPLRVTMQNRSGRDVVWSFETASSVAGYRGEHSATGQFGMDVSAGSSRRIMVLAPMAVSYGNAGYGGSSSMRVTAASRIMGTESDTHFSERVDSFPCIAMSRGLAAVVLTKLEDALEKKMSSASRYGSGQRLFAARFEPKQLPEDWLGLSGLDFLILQTGDWEVLNPGQRRAIFQWVRLGGRLHVYKNGKGDLQELGFPNVKGDKMNVSQGEVVMYGWDGKELNSTSVVNRYWGEPTRLKRLREQYAGTTTWGLREALGERSFAAWQVLVFLAIFGILVGPINLFVLAPPGKRHKLFFTTPILSLGASVVMIGLILFQDGIGGEGRRAVVVELQPEEALAYLSQEQISRNGMLTSTGFTLKQPALIQAVALPESPWTKLTHSSDSQSSSLQLAGLDVSGSLFQSRTEQAQLIQTPVSTRARIELKRGAAPDVPPTVVSALGFAVESLFYVDEAGVTWAAPQDVNAGSEVTLVKTDAEALTKRFNEALKICGAQAAGHLRRGLEQRRGQFFALAKAAPDFVQPTLPSIRWKNDHVIVFGPVKQL